MGAIVGLILLGSFLWIAISTALKEEKHGGYGGGYRKRSADEEKLEFSFLDFLIMLDDTFGKLEINDLECRQRAACEAYLKTGSLEEKVKQVALRVTYILG